MINKYSMEYLKNKIKIIEDLYIIICTEVPILTHMIVNIFTVHAL